MLALIISLVGVFVICLVVFGGGQVFMPLFKSLWILMSDAGANISSEQIDQIFAIANSTPGVISTKFALFSGYLASNGAWWGWIALFVTYLVFIIPAMVAIILAMKMVTKIESFQHLKKVVLFLKPVIAGIVIALSIQLFIGTAFPKLVFNGFNEYLGTKPSLFNGWRLIGLVVYSVVMATGTAYLYYKKVNIFALVSVSVVIGMLVFQPWLM